MSDGADVLERVRRVVAKQFGAELEEVVADTLITGGGAFDADSLDQVEITMDVEDEFKIAIPDDELDGAKTVADLAKAVQRRLAVSA